nr:MAG TPA: hypothetical protein [Caudoviricetes sp.]
MRVEHLQVETILKFIILIQKEMKLKKKMH